MRAYYNEIDKYAAAWLRELIAEGLIADGDVDERSITEVTADDVRGYNQVHFFAGIGGWSLALRLAGWPDARPVWTGSCPCQPFSTAGKGLGTDDERHLWPELARLIRTGKPSVCFGEQVASRAGREWLARVFADLEGMGYRRAGADLCSAGVGAPNIRQRLWWVADAEHGRQTIEEQGKKPRHGGDPRGMGNASVQGLEGCRQHEQQHGSQVRQVAERHGASAGVWGPAIPIPCGDGKTRRIEPGLEPLVDGVPARVVRLRGYGNAINPYIAAKFIGAYMQVTQGG